MEGQNGPKSRKVKIVNSGKGIARKGEGLGTGPVNNTGNYADRREQNAQTRPPQSSGFSSQSPESQRKPAPFNVRPFQNNTENTSHEQNPFSASGRTGGKISPFGQRPSQGSGTRPVSYSQRPAGTRPRETGNGSATGSNLNNGTNHTQRAGGGGSKLIMIVIAAVVLLFGSRFLGGDGQDNLTNTVPAGSNNSITAGSPSSGTGMMTDLLSMFMNSGSSVYDFTGGNLLSSVTGNTNESQPYYPVSEYSGTAEPDNTVSVSARSKYTHILGNKQDTVTIMVYMCGTDLESQNGMATSDVKEMLNARIGDHVNVLIYTGGCRKWKNNVFSPSVNQIYQIRNGKLVCLEENMGTASMTNPSTLQSFIAYGKENFPANRMCLILWDHGGGSVTGYGYDEKYGRNQSMTLSGINTALKNSGVKFDFIGFDACLMATVENGIMLSQYADYMIASEETEPGVGWYYTNWMTKLSDNPSMPTVSIGKMIADDFVEVCAKQCRGQATTLSVVDLAELEATVPEQLKSFSIDTNSMIQNREYKAVSTARSRTREFAQSSRIDQIDLVHFALNMNTAEGKKLAEALKGSVKYNRTGGGITNAYGLSIYFPYKRSGNVNKVVSTYRDIGMDEEYTRCIQEFASLEISGQISAGNSISSYNNGSQTTGLPGLLGSLTGSGYQSGTGLYGDELGGMLGGLFGGGSASGSLLDLFTGRTMSAEKASGYITENHFDPSLLKWQNGRITLPPSQWDLVTGLVINVFYDDGEGYLDLGTDNVFNRSGNSLMEEFNGSWVSIDGQPVAYYFLSSVEDGKGDLISKGYVPAFLNGVRVNLMITFDSEHDGYGFISGAQIVYPDTEPGVEAKNLIAVGKGDRLLFICDYYDYAENYQDSYPIGEITLGDSTIVANTMLGDSSVCKATYRFTDIYQNNYWTTPVQ